MPKLLTTPAAIGGEALTLGLPQLVAATRQRAPELGTPAPERRRRPQARQLDPYVSPTSWRCTSKRCSPVVANPIACWSGTHLTAVNSASLFGVMGLALRSIS